MGLRGTISNPFEVEGTLLQTVTSLQTVTVELDVVSDAAFETLQELMAKANEIGKRTL